MHKFSIKYIKCLARHKYLENIHSCFVQSLTQKDNFLRQNYLSKVPESCNVLGVIFLIRKMSQQNLNFFFFHLENCGCEASSALTRNRSSNYTVNMITGCWFPFTHCKKSLCWTTRSDKEIIFFLYCLCWDKYFHDTYLISSFILLLFFTIYIKLIIEIKCPSEFDNGFS